MDDDALYEIWEKVGQKIRGLFNSIPSGMQFIAMPTLGESRHEEVAQLRARVIIMHESFTSINLGGMGFF